MFQTSTHGLAVHCSVTVDWMGDELTFYRSGQMTIKRVEFSLIHAHASHMVSWNCCFMAALAWVC